MSNVTYRKNEDLKVIKEGWRGNRVEKGRFINLEAHVKHGVGSVLKWRLSRNPQWKEKKEERWDPEIVPLESIDSIYRNALVWLGHNSFYMYLGGKRIMFDPVFGNIPFVKRRSKMPANPDIFQNIDYLLLSHDHYDHMDKKSVKKVCQNSPELTVICGLGVGELIKQWSPKTRVIECGWYQQVEEQGLKITFMPCQHWGKRSASDGGTRLWGAFMVQDSDLSIYYSGDTGYGKHFTEIKHLFGEPHYAMLGIGAYKPRWFMQPNHISPYEALDASAEMGAQMTIPMHYGTFDLSDEPFSDPPTVFAKEAEERDIRINIPKLGEVVYL